MKKYTFVFLLTFTMFSFSEKLEFYKIENEKNNKSTVGMGMQYKGLSLEAVYQKKFAYIQDNEKLKEYFKNGNTIGINFNYNIGDIKSKRPKILVENSNDKNDSTLLNVIKNDYKLKNKNNMDELYSSNTNKILNSGILILKENSKTQNELIKQRISKVSKILKINSNKIVKIYGEIKGVKVNTQVNSNNGYLSSNKLVLYFDKEK